MLMAILLSSKLCELHLCEAVKLWVQRPGLTFVSLYYKMIDSEWTFTLNQIFCIFFFVESLKRCGGLFASKGKCKESWGVSQ